MYPDHKHNKINKILVRLMLGLGIVIVVVLLVSQSSTTPGTPSPWPHINLPGGQEEPGTLPESPSSSPTSPENPPSDITPTGNPAVTDMDATLAITTATTPTILKSTFGIQTRGLFDEMEYDRYNPDVYNSRTNAFTPENRLMQNIYDLAMQTFRYPAGTLSRYVHPGTVANPTKGYGINAAEIIKDNALYGRDWFSGGSCTAEKCNYVTDYQNYLPHSFTTDLVDIAHKSGTDRSVIVVANLWYGTPAEAVTQVTDFINAGQAVVGVEMGVEHFSYRSVNGVQVPTAGINMHASEYLTKARVTAQAIRDVYPQMKIGLVASNSYPATHPAHAIYQAWDQAMAQAIHTETYNGTALFTDYIPHIYRTVNCNPLDARYSGSANADLAACAKYKINKLAHSDAPTASTWGELNRLTAEQTFDYFRGIYGSTPMWITEWGLANDEGGADSPAGNAYANTLMFGVYMQDFYNSINKYNALHGNVITLAYYHTIGGSDISNSAISKKQSGEQFTDQKDSAYVRRTPWFALKTMSPLYNLPSAVLATTQATITPTSTPYLNMTSYLDPTNKMIYVYFNNTSGHSAKIADLTLDGKKLGGGTAASAEIVSGTNLFAGNGANYFNPKGTESTINYNNTIYNQVIDSIVIPGYSFGYIKFGI